MSKRLLGPAQVPDGRPAYSPAVTYDFGGHTMIFIAGRIAVDEQGNTVRPNDAAGQTRFIFEKIKALLAKADASVNDLVKINIYITDIKDVTSVREARNSYLKEALPVATLLEVNATVRPDCCVEIDAVAIGGSS